MSPWFTRRGPAFRPGGLKAEIAWLPALDLGAMLVVAFLTLFALARRRDAFLDAALALVAFLATVAFVRFIERARGRGEGRE